MLLYGHGYKMNTSITRPLQSCSKHLINNEKWSNDELVSLYLFGLNFL